MNNIKEFDIAIIGGGPSGLTAAIYAQRANLKSCFIEKGAPGGKMVITANIENYPGIKTIEGPNLSLAMYEQALELGAEHIGVEAVQIKENGIYKQVLLKNGELIQAKAVVIAIGTENRKLDIPGEEKFVGRGVSYCAICDGAFYKGKEVAVVGSGNSACEESLYLSQIVKKVTLVVRSEKFKADASVIEEVMKSPNITVMFNTDSKEIGGTNKVEYITVFDKIKQIESKLAVSAVFPFVGLSAHSIGAANSIAKTPTNFILVDPNMKTSIDGIYATGDIVDKKYRQISTAINDGTIAALAAKEYINKNFKK